MLGLCVFEGHILMNILCLLLLFLPFYKSYCKGGLAGGIKVENAIILKSAMTAKLHF